MVEALIIVALVVANGLFAAAGTVSVVEKLPLGAASPYVYVPSGPVEIALRGPRGGAFYRGLHALEEGRAYTVLAAGEDDYLIMVRVLTD